MGDESMQTTGLATKSTHCLSMPSLFFSYSLHFLPLCVSRLSPWMWTSHMAMLEEGLCNQLSSDRFFRLWVFWYGGEWARVSERRGRKMSVTVSRLLFPSPFFSSFFLSLFPFCTSYFSSARLRAGIKLSRFRDTLYMLRPLSGSHAALSRRFDDRPRCYSQ